MLDIILDCDPGQDDAIAILMAIANRNLNIKGITTVAGNVSGEQTYINAQKVCACANRFDIPVYKGALHPLRKKLITAECIHGENGLSCDIDICNNNDQTKTAIDFIIQELSSAKGKITIAATAPLTNIAIALQKEPTIANNIKQIVLMGGSTTEGNITKYAEFNFFTDPDAAKIVFNSGIDIVMIGLNVTEQAVFAEPEIQAIKDINTETTDHAATILTDLMITNRDVYGYSGGLVHDACVIAYLTDPSIFDFKTANVAIETEDKIKMGQSVVDFNSDTKNAHIAIGIDRNRLLAVINQLFRYYSNPNLKSA